MNRATGILSLLLLTWAYAQAESFSSTESHTETESEEFESISMVVDQLANMAVDISDEHTLQLKKNIERALADITDNIEALTNNAMADISLAIDDTNHLLMDNPSCNAAWNVQEFAVNVTEQLSECTSWLSHMVNIYRNDSEQVIASVGGLIQQIAQLPILCRDQIMGAALIPLGLVPDDSNTCFLRGITKINQELAQAMHAGSLLLVQARRLSQEQMPQAQQCSANVSAQVNEFLSVLRANCS